MLDFAFNFKSVWKNLSYCGSSQAPVLLDSVSACHSILRNGCGYNMMLPELTGMMASQRYHDFPIKTNGKVDDAFSIDSELLESDTQMAEKSIKWHPGDSMIPCKPWACVLLISREWSFTWFLENLLCLKFTNRRKQMLRKGSCDIVYPCSHRC